MHDEVKVFMTPQHKCLVLYTTTLFLLMNIDTS